MAKAIRVDLQLVQWTGTKDLALEAWPTASLPRIFPIRISMFFLEDASICTHQSMEPYIRILTVLLQNVYYYFYFYFWMQNLRDFHKRPFENLEKNWKQNIKFKDIVLGTFISLDCEQSLLFPPVIVHRARKRRPRGERDERRTDERKRKRRNCGQLTGVWIPAPCHQDRIFICFQLVHDTIIFYVDLLSEAGDFRKLFRTFQGDLPCVIIEFCY